MLGNAEAMGLVEAAVADVDRLIVPEEPQRVDQRDETEEVPGVGDAVEGTRRCRAVKGYLLVLPRALSCDAVAVRADSDDDR